MSGKPEGAGRRGARGTKGCPQSGDDQLGLHPHYRSGRRHGKSSAACAPGQYLSVGTQVISLVPLPNVWVIANYKETQMTNIRTGQKARVTVDAFPGKVLHGHVDSWSPASGAEFSLLPPDNATGNFTKVVQRIPVKIVLDRDPSSGDLLRPGMSVIATIDTNSKLPIRAAPNRHDMVRCGNLLSAWSAIFREPRCRAAAKPLSSRRSRRATRPVISARPFIGVLAVLIGLRYLDTRQPHHRLRSRRRSRCGACGLRRRGVDHHRLHRLAK